MKALNIIIAVLLLVGAGWWYLHSGFSFGQPAALADGVHFGFIRSVHTAQGTIRFDDASMLTGKAAQDAAIAAGVCTQDTLNDCLPNDYYIDNPSHATVPLPLAPDATITFQTLGAETEGIKRRSVSHAEFAEHTSIRCHDARRTSHLSRRSLCSVI